MDYNKINKFLDEIVDDEKDEVMIQLHYRQLIEYIL